MMKTFVQVADGAQQVLRAASEIGIIGVNGRRVRVPIAGNSHLDGECIDAVVQGGRVRLATFSGDSKDGTQRSNGENAIPGRTEATKNKFSTHGPIAIAATKPSNPAKSLEYCATIGSLNPRTPPKRLRTFPTRSSNAPP